MAANKLASDHEALMSAAEKVDASASELGHQVQRFQTAVETLNKTWSSDVKTKFFTSYDKDLKALREMVDQYGEVANGIRTIAENHQKTEDEINAQLEKAGKACG